MIERKAWQCTGCGKVHAPHVDTCSEPVIAIGPALPGSQYQAPRPPTWTSRWPMTVPHDPADLFPRTVSGIVMNDPPGATLQN